MNKTKKILMTTTLTIIAIIVIWPFIQMFLSSFMTYEETISTPPVYIPKAFNIEGYLKVLKSDDYLTFYANSIITTILRVLGTLATCSMAGYAFAKLDFVGKKFIFWIILGIMMVPGQMFTLPQYLTMSKFGWLDSLTAIIVPNIFSAYGIFMMTQFFKVVPSALIESARVDGASEFTIFRKVCLPLVSPGLAVLGLQTTVGAWNDLIWPLIVNRSPDKLTLPVSIAKMSGQYAVDIPTQMAAAVISVVPMLIVYLLVQKRFNDIGISAAIK